METLQRLPYEDFTNHESLPELQDAGEEMTSEDLTISVGETVQLIGNDLEYPIKGKHAVVEQIEFDGLVVNCDGKRLYVFNHEVIK